MGESMYHYLLRKLTVTLLPKNDKYPYVGSGLHHMIPFMF